MDGSGTTGTVGGQAAAGRATEATAVEVRLLAARDSIADLTTLLHRAHAPLVAQGLVLPDAGQTPEVTQQRLIGGQSFVACVRRQIVGLATLRGPHDMGGSPWLAGHGEYRYRDRDTVHLEQFAVDPGLQRQGVGRRLLTEGERWALERGYRRVAVDLPQRAVALRALLRRHGYAELPHDDAADRVVLEKTLDHSPLREHLRLLARYNLWATRVLFQHLDLLPEADYRRDAGLFFRSVHGTLNHLLLAEHEFWYRRFAEGRSEPMALDAEIEADRAALRERLVDGALAWLPLIDVWPESRLLGHLQYHRSDGQAAELPFAATLMHVFNHGTHHRGQITAALTALGWPCPEIDLVRMLAWEQEQMREPAHEQEATKP